MAWLPTRARRLDLLALVCTLGALLWLVWPLLEGGLSVGGHDATTHFLWQQGVRAERQDGSVYPRWLTNLDDGWGSPVFFYYPPLAHLVAAWLGEIFGLGILRSLGAALGLSTCAGALGVFVWLRGHGPRVAAVVGALLYASLPALLRVDVYERAAFAEAFAFAWPPWVLLGLDAVRQRGTRGALCLALPLAGLLGTHPPSSVAAAPLLSLYALWPLPSPRHWRGLAVGGGVAALLAAPYLCTALTMRDFAHFDQMVGGHYGYQHWFLFFAQVPAAKDVAILQLWRGAAVGASLVAVPALAAALVVARGEGRRPRRLMSLAAAAAFCWFMYLPVSSPLWKGVAILQFPARFHITLQLACVGLVGLGLGVVARGARRGLRGALPALYLAAAAYTLTAAHEAQLQRQQQFAGRRLPRAPLAQRREAPEYALSRSPWRRGVLDATELARPTAGQARVTVPLWREREVGLHVEAQTPARVVVRQSWFTGWELAAGSDAARVSELRGVVSLSVPAGVHDLRLVQPRRAWERAGYGLGWLGLVLALALALWRLGEYVRERPPSAPAT